MRGLLLLLAWILTFALFYVVGYAILSLSGCSSPDQPAPEPVPFPEPTLASDAGRPPTVYSGAGDASADVWTGLSGGDGTTTGSAGGCCDWDAITKKCYRKCER